VRICVDNPANPVSLLVGTARVLTCRGQLILEALRPAEGVALKELAREFPGWISVLPETTEAHRSD
jgi:hypothetical protein